MSTGSEKPPSRDDIKDAMLPFLSAYLGITDLEKLRDHVFKIWTECTESVWSFQCIKRLYFLFPRIQEHFYYKDGSMLQIAKSNPAARFLDLGCCFATDTRKVVLDGWNPKNIVALDVVDDYWKFGLNLFKDADTLQFEGKFGNIITDEKLCKELGQFSVIWTGQVLHVLNEFDVIGLLRGIFSLLESGGTYIGSCVASDKPGVWIVGPQIRYLHSGETLTKLLTEIGFVNVDVQIMFLPKASLDSKLDPEYRVNCALNYRAQKL